MSVSGEVYVVLARGEEREDIWCAGLARTREGAESIMNQSYAAVRQQGIETDRYWVSGPKEILDS